MATSEPLFAAQRKAHLLFHEIRSRKLVRPGVLESKLSQEIGQLTRSMFGIEKHWHKRIVRSGENTLSSVREEPPDRFLADDDIAYIDLGPIFEEWEADFGHTFVLGNDPRKHKLVGDLERVFQQIKRYFHDRENITGAELFAYAQSVAMEHGWIFGADNAGHLIGRFPHSRTEGAEHCDRISSLNHTVLRDNDSEGRRRHWILEIKLIDPVTQRFAGFYEDILHV